MGDYNLEEIKWKDIRISDILTIPIWILFSSISGMGGAMIIAYTEVFRKLCHERGSIKDIKNE